MTVNYIRTWRKHTFYMGPCGRSVQKQKKKLISLLTMIRSLRSNLRSENSSHKEVVLKSISS